MANKEANNFKAALNELLSGKTTTEEKKPPLFREDTFEQDIKKDIIEPLDEEIEELTETVAAIYGNIEQTKPYIEDELDAKDEGDEDDEDDDKKEIGEPIIENYNTMPQVSVVAMERAVEEKAVSNETTIAHDVIIEGNIKSSSKLRIVGEVTGDVKSTADVVIEGKVGGSIQGCNIFLSECEVNNSITATNEVTISERSMVNGDVKAGAVVSNGVVNGNLDAHNVTLNGASRTVGNVKCKLIKIGEGAGLKGNLETID